MRTGRPREFDLDQKLDSAVLVFWRQGYEGTAISDLTDALGINRPSLYAAFGNKESLFRRVLERYSEQRAVYLLESLKEPTARSVVEHLLRGASEATTGRGLPNGCLLVQGALATGPDSDPIRQELDASRRSGEAAIQARLRRAQDEGDLPPDADTAELARYVCTLLQGIAVQAAGGATRAQLYRVCEMTMAGWDTLVAASTS
ncbi:TetR/AcrR family transcriptional regulator [Pseudonocardia alaniniphila]|uniref:TetR/AcrR family transcriptional regulator n=1 Tax=Pseudonocardia alaniniphila TaxID=75291 RepID=A0ABS9TEG0_9PSEU|nr:TetR/AcrR family transcriptional regulator [Pseudonocardia alaniniphila]MCH6166929.1 TetR/AcrR family transcriptional regulator [Pseudonocardia alaniniphila]